MSRRKPVELRLVEGNPGKRALPSSPASAPLLADPPRHLDRRGRALWRAVVDAFPEAPVVQASDAPALRCLCEAFQLQQDALDDLRERGVVVESCRADRELVRNPSAMVYAAATAVVVKLLGQFAMTPADRSRFDVPPAASEPSVLDEIIEANRRDRPAAQAEAQARRARRSR